jgi:hypothetical protein
MRVTSSLLIVDVAGLQRFLRRTGYQDAYPPDRGFVLWSVRRMIFTGIGLNWPPCRSPSLLASRVSAHVRQ